MFPPQKKKPGQPGQGPPQGPGGPPDPFAAPGGGQPPMGPPGMGAPGMDPFGGGGMGMGQPDPFGGMPPAPGLQPGMPKPGQGMDPMQAMTSGLQGPDPMADQTPGAQGPPLGPGGLPVGGQMPPTGDDGMDPTMGGSPLLQALYAQLSGGGDPYGVAPGQPDQGFQGMGTNDPNMGVEQLLQMLALGQLGVGGGPSPGSSGAMDLGPFMGNGVGAGVGL